MTTIDLMEVAAVAAEGEERPVARVDVRTGKRDARYHDRR